MSECFLYFKKITSYEKTIKREPNFVFDLFALIENDHM